MDSIEIRKKFLNFFKENGHSIISSSPLIPAEDPTLLFTNAGMNQFKGLFLGREKRSYNCAVTVQKCVRAGGKHNDLEEVGFTDRHLTFFEMLGNFSFGAYFKERAIELAWKFLTETIGIPKEKLSVTVHTSDDEAEQIWLEKIGLSEDKVSRLGDEDNFWQMGETGPCGPCSEIFYDRGAEFEEGIVDGRVVTRYIEIWNLVFIQFNRQADGTLEPLEQKGVDTGMGFERLCMVVNNKGLFETDLFLKLRKFLEEKTSLLYESSSDEIQVSFNVLCDHVRSSALIIADGGYPANDGRGYVLRKIIRRAALFAQKLSESPKLFCELVPCFIEQMGEVCPELKINEITIIKTIEQELERFSENLIRGRRIFNSYVEQNRRDGVDELTGKQVFKLYDTYGFPVELTKVLAMDENGTVDLDGFELEMEYQRSQSGNANGEDVNLDLPNDIATEFVGYDVLEMESKVSWVGGDDWICTESSPFYAESGGQVSDKGVVVANGKELEVLEVRKVSVSSGSTAIVLKLSSVDNIKPGQVVRVKVDQNSRKATEKNHTATHLLQAALNAVFGGQVKQAGSHVSSEALRFDFTHYKALVAEEIRTIETLVNEWIGRALPTRTFNTTLDQAREKGALAFFGEKYNPENVRVVQVPTISIELCGGTHVSNIGKIGCCKIVSEEALGVGVRRLTAVTGKEAVRLFQDRFQTVRALGEMFSVKADGVFAAVEKEQESLHTLRRQIKTLKKEILKLQIPRWKDSMEMVGDVPFLLLEFDDADIDIMRIICNDIIGHEPNGFVFILSHDNDGKKTKFMACAGKKYAQKIDLSNLSALLREKGLKGGGKGTCVQGGGPMIKGDEIRKILNIWMAGKSS